MHQTRYIQTTSVEPISGPATGATEILSCPLWEMPISGSILWPPHAIERVIELMHYYSGMPWWITIIAYTVSIRTLLLPITVNQIRSTIASHNLKPKIQSMQSEMQRLSNEGKADQKMQKMRELADFLTRNKINPVTILAKSLVPIPVFMATFFAIRDMALFPVTSFVTGGALWFVDLSIPDPYYILPIASSLSLLVSMEVFYATLPYFD